MGNMNARKYGIHEHAYYYMYNTYLYVSFVAIHLWLLCFRQLQRFSGDLKFFEFIRVPPSLLHLSLSLTAGLLRGECPFIFLLRKIAIFYSLCSPECFLWITMNTCTRRSHRTLPVSSRAQLYRVKGSVNYAKRKAEKLCTFTGLIN